jgi:enoyl-CoA hydratase/carnithine racemase
MGAAWLLPRIVGMGHASELLMRGEFISAERAAEIGLYNRVAEDQEALDALALEWAQGLANGPELGLAVTKRMLNEEAHMGLAEAMQKEGWIQAECMRDPAYKAIVAGFKEKKANKERAGGTSK